MREREPSWSECAILVGWWLARGERLTSGELARRLGINRTSAWRLLRRAERVLPVVTSAQTRRTRTD